MTKQSAKMVVLELKDQKVQVHWAGWFENMSNRQYSVTQTVEIPDVLKGSELVSSLSGLEYGVQSNLC